MASTRPTCDRCGHVHTSTWARAQGRFHARGPVRYRAALPGAPLRTTRRDAEQDVCDHLAKAAS